MGRASRDRAELGDDVHADALIQLASDDWAWLLVHLRAVLEIAGDEALGERGVHLRELPVGRLAGGEQRIALCRLVVDNGTVGSLLADRLAGRADLPDAVARAMDSAPSGDATDVDHDDGDDEAEADGDSADETVARLRDRLRRVRAERDEQRRRAEGAQARAQRLESERDQKADELTTAMRQVASLQAALEGASDEQRRAVDRERRRTAARVEQLERQLTELRRDAERRRRDDDRPREQGTPRSSPSRSPRGAPAAPRVVAGRPTRVPDHVEPGTREFAELLLERDRLVLVDGYNVTLRHRGELSLAEQRRWLIQLAGTAAQRRGVRIELVFDGADTSPRPPAGRPPRDVRIRFTEAGITADDEIVLAVEATDDPVVVVTDDAELTERVRRVDADVLGVDPFVWAVR